MALAKCSECGNDVSTGAKNCPKCGAKLSKPKTWLLIPVGAVVLFVLFALLRTPSPEEVKKSNARSQVEYCWTDHKRASLPPTEKRFIAGACEKKEQEFVAKYGARP